MLLCQLGFQFRKFENSLLESWPLRYESELRSAVLVTLQNSYNSNLFYLFIYLLFFNILLSFSSFSFSSVSLPFLFLSRVLQIHVLFFLIFIIFSCLFYFLFLISNKILKLFSFYFNASSSPVYPYHYRHHYCHIILFISSKYASRI